jgi:hypothetical protein
LGAVLALMALMAVTTLLPSYAHASQDDQLQELRRQMNELQARITSMEAEAKKRQADDEVRRRAAEEEVKKRPADGGFLVGNTSVKLGGTLKLDTVYNVNQDLGSKAFPFNIDPTLSHSERASGGHTNISARPTQLRVMTSTPTDHGPVVGFVETDFDSSAGGNELATNSYGLRLRHAYFAWNGWLFGQTWTTFSDFHFPKILDYQAPIGVAFVRQPQIRYTMQLGGGSALDLALENPDGEIRGTGGSVIASNLQLDTECQPGATQCGAQNSVPDVVARYRYQSGPVSFQVAALGRYLKLNGATADKSAYGWGLNAGGSYKLPIGTTLSVTSFGGKGLDRYLFTPYVGDAYVNNSGDVTPIKRWGVAVGVSQPLPRGWTANVVWGATGVGSLDGQKAALNARCAFAHTQQGLGCVGARFSDLHANLLYKVTDGLVVGGEYIYTGVRYQDGQTGSANTLMFSAEYAF